MYSDTNEYQSELRKAFWDCADKDIQRSFYHWAMQLYKTGLYHASPIKQSRSSPERPMRLYHGM